MKQAKRGGNAFVPVSSFFDQPFTGECLRYHQREKTCEPRRVSRDPCDPNDRRPEAHSPALPGISLVRDTCRTVSPYPRKVTGLFSTVSLDDVCRPTNPSRVSPSYAYHTPTCPTKPLPLSNYDRRFAKSEASGVSDGSRSRTRR